jgi:periplasmic protein TonB
MVLLRRLRLFLVLSLLAGSAASLCADDTVYTKVDVKPVPVRTPPPEYPYNLKREGISGVVAIMFVVDEAGAVIDPSVVKTSHPDFAEPAIAAVKKWKFKPGQVGGNAVKVKVTIPLHFSLNE